MTTTSKSAIPRAPYHPNAYEFVFAALRCTQRLLGRSLARGPDDDDAHLSAEELLEGIRELALDQFGLMTITVFRHWGVQSTEDFGRMVFELIERGEMRKTEQDQLSDFFDVYDFEDVFDRGYKIDTRNTFRE